VKETEQEKKDRKTRQEFYNQWAASVHHSGGRQGMAEIVEIDDAVISGNSGAASQASSSQ
jgi:hypothetical protein